MSLRSMKYEQSKHISVLIKDFVKEARLSEGISRTHVFDAWDAVVLEITAGAYTPEKAAALTGSKFLKDRALTVVLTSSMVRMQFQMNAAAILSRLNAKLAPEERVVKIIFR